MRSFKNYYISEAVSVDKTLHFDHIEDLMIQNGREGLTDCILMLNNIIRQVAGISSSDLQVKLKFDGSPSLVCGIDPETKKFFVGTKSVFNKESPKINYTSEDIDKNHPEVDLNKKLKIALKYLPELGIKGVVQGDMMFIHDSLSKKEVGGIECVTFKPNTLTYVIPVDSDLGRDILKAKIGMVFHTEYHGNTIPTLKASYNIDTSKFKKTPDVWFKDADFENLGKKSNLSADDVKNITDKYNSIKKISKEIDSTFFDKLESDSTLRDFMLAFNNFLVRKGSFNESSDKKYNDLVQYVKDKFSGEESVAKTERGKEKKVNRLQYMSDILSSYKDSIIQFFDLQNRIIDIKMDVVNDLNKIKGIGTYIDKGGQLVPTNPEGFIATGKEGTVKLIDRSTFSKQNFENNRE